MLSKLWLPRYKQLNISSKYSNTTNTLVFVVDINECGERNGLCSDVCINEDYSYQCGCAPGRTLADDEFNCGSKYRKHQFYILFEFHFQYATEMDSSIYLVTEWRLDATGGKLLILTSIDTIYHMPFSHLASVWVMMQVLNVGTALYTHVNQLVSPMGNSTTLVTWSTRDKTYGKEIPMYTNTVIMCTLL